MASGMLGRLKDSVRAGLAGRRRNEGGRTVGSGRDGARSGREDAPRSGGSSSANPSSGTGGIAVSYAPERDGDADPGEIVWAWVPYEDDPTQGKDRPVLILGHDGPQLAGVQLSSKNHDDRHDEHEWVPVGSGAWDSQNRPSHADASRLLRFDPAAVRREGAALDRKRFDEVLARVARIHDWTDHR